VLVLLFRKLAKIQVGAGTKRASVAKRPKSQSFFWEKVRAFFRKVWFEVQWGYFYLTHYRAVEGLLVTIEKKGEKKKNAKKESETFRMYLARLYEEGNILPEDKTIQHMLEAACEDYEKIYFSKRMRKSEMRLLRKDIRMLRRRIQRVL